jgi:LPXTG-site transpeptidase (sortase) family protein
VGVGQTGTIETASGWNEGSLSVLPKSEALGVEEEVNPKYVEIESIGLKSKIVAVGLNEKRVMIVPDENDLVSWYKLGSHPGQLGSAVLAGHNEWNGPGVFKDLHKVEVGDEIKIIGDKDRIINFLITKIEVYDKKDFPIKKVYSQKDKERLNIITCHGRYNKENKRYEDRLVVYAEIKK